MISGINWFAQINHKFHIPENEEIIDIDRSRDSIVLKSHGIVLSISSSSSDEKSSAMQRTSCVNMYRDPFHVTFAISRPVQENDMDVCGTVRLRLPPPIGCSIVNGKVLSSFIALLKTNLISCLASCSAISLDKCTLPIRPFLARLTRFAPKDVHD